MDASKCAMFELIPASSDEPLGNDDGLSQSESELDEQASLSRLSNQRYDSYSMCVSPCREPFFVVFLFVSFF